MLRHLSIRNIVLIEQLAIDFSDGLCVLTGETGSGKSILLDALGLALGERGEASLVRHGADQGSVTAEFDGAVSDELQSILDELDIQSTDDDTLVLRRTLGANGKGRAFVNDQPVSIAGLKRVGDALVEIHGQHSQRGLMNSACHSEILDAYGRHENLCDDVKQAYAAWHGLRKKREKLLAAQEAAKAEESYLRHMAEELAKLNPQAGEEEELAEKRQQIMQQEKWADTLQSALNALAGDNNHVQQAIQSAERVLSRSPLAGAERFAPAIEALARASIEVEEALVTIERVQSDTVFDAMEQERVESRYFELKDAARKYRCTPDELVELYTTTREKLALMDNTEQSLGTLDAEITMAKQAYADVAKQLSAARLEAAKQMETVIHKELAPLKMEATRFVVECEPLQESEWNAGGQERVTFLASTNPGSPPSALAKIASGGELSRFMLALKVALAEVDSVPVMIFDEIDTGVSGAVAEAIGRRLSQLGQKQIQVLVVTHLPQVAAFGAHHLRIFKEVSGGHTHTHVETLDKPMRTEEVARMLAGENISDEARAAADKLLKVS